ncbi:MAG: hypothetical protein ACO3QB_08770 [bacterium]
MQSLLSERNPDESRRISRMDSWPLGRQHRVLGLALLPARVGWRPALIQRLH